MKNHYLFAVVIALGLTACGGGGGGDSGSVGPLPLLTITSSNYAGVATNSVAKANGTTSVSSLGTSLVGAQIAQTDSIAIKDIALSTASVLLDNWVMFDKPTIVGVVTSRTVNCPGGGTLSAVANANSSLTPSAGDTVSATLTNCYLNGTLTNGSLSMVINSYSGNFSTSGTGSLTMQFNNLTAGSDAVSGSITMNATIAGGTISNLTLTMPTFSVSSNGEYFSYTGFTMAISTIGLSQSLNMAGNISSSRYGGSVVISTPTTLAVDASRRVTGEIRITGKNGTKARIVGQNSTIIRIEADTTGTGTYDVNTTVNLASLGL